MEQVNAVNGVAVETKQTWLTRNGTKVLIASIMPPEDESMYPIQGIVLETGVVLTWAATGHRFRGVSHETDLVKLLDDQPEPAERMGASLAEGFITAQELRDNPHPIGRLLKADIEHVEGYELLADVLVRAHDQASKGKGKERHARAATPFHEQPMATINQQIGSVDGFIYQAHKKSLEALRLPHGRNVAELLGAINYLAGAVIALETWAKKGEV